MASPLTLEGHFISEIVDLRLPPSTLFDTARVYPWANAFNLQGPIPLARESRLQLTEEQALAWLDYFKRTERLTLRDPRNLSHAGRPCRLVTLSIRIGCAGHISHLAQDEPDLENYCTRRLGS